MTTACLESQSPSMLVNRYNVLVDNVMFNAFLNVHLYEHNKGVATKCILNGTGLWICLWLYLYRAIMFMSAFCERSLLHEECYMRGELIQNSSICSFIKQHFKNPFTSLDFRGQMS